MADEVKEEQPRIESYYQGQGKYLVDMLFDLGCLSESLSRDGMTRVEDLAALMFQQIGVHSKVEGGGSIPPKRPQFGEGSILDGAIKCERERASAAIDESRGGSGPSPALSEIRLIQAMRKIDPDLAHMIESLAPAYLVKG